VDEDGEYSEKFNIKVIRIILAGFTYLRKPESPNTFHQYPVLNRAIRVGILARLQARQFSLRGFTFI